MVALLNRQVAFVAPGCQKIDGPLSGRFPAAVALQFLFQECDNLLPMLPLTLRLLEVVAEDIASSAFAVVNNDLLGMEIILDHGIRLYLKDD